MKDFVNRDRLHLAGREQPGVVPLTLLRGQDKLSFADSVRTEYSNSFDLIPIPGAA